jgi:hypothetical protein
MGLNSTPLLSYQEIFVHEIDIYDDAWGFCQEFNDVINLIKQVKKPVAGKRLTQKLIAKVRSNSEIPKAVSAKYETAFIFPFY